MRLIQAVAFFLLATFFATEATLQAFTGSDNFASPTLNTNLWKFHDGRLRLPLSARYIQTNGYVSFSSPNANGEYWGLIFWNRSLPVNQSWRVQATARFSSPSIRVSPGSVEGMIGVVPNLDDPRSKFVMTLGVDSGGIYSVPNWGVNSRTAGATDGELKINHGLSEVILFLDYDAIQKTITASYASVTQPGRIIPGKTLSTANWNGLQSFQLLLGGYSDNAAMAAGILRMDDVIVSSSSPPRYEDMVPVLNPFNPGNPDNSGLGGVNYNYAISRTEITVRQYCRFLNSVAKRSNPVTLALYSNTFRQYSQTKTVERLGTHPNFSYVPANGQDYLPIEVPWLDAARYCNWMHQGARPNANLEDGAYPLRGALNGWTGIRRNPSARFYVPSADEWYKAGYYDPNKTGPNQGGYWATAYRSDVYSYNSSNEIVLEPNRANFNTGAGWLPVGSYPNGSSYYGTYDQVGNSWEWISDRYLYDQQGLMGGNWTVAGGSDSYGPGDGATGWIYAENAPEHCAAFRLATRLAPQGPYGCPGVRGRELSFRVSPGPEFFDATYLSYSATGLPAGLSINPTSGVISGKPTGAGMVSNCVVRIAVAGGDETLAVNVPLVFDLRASAPSGFALSAGQVALANRNLPEAVRQFNLAVNDEPANPTNRVYRALSSLALLQQNAAGNAILDKFFVIPSPTPWDAFGDVDTRAYRVDPRAYKTDSDGNVDYQPKNPAVSTAEIVNLLRNVHLPVEQAAENDLATITNTNLLVTIPSELAGSSTVNLDYGDIQMLRALLAAKRAVDYFVSIHNWDMTINNWQTIVAKNGRDERVTLENILSTLPRLLRLNRAADGPSCRLELKNAAVRYFAASDFIRNDFARTNPESPTPSRLFNLSPIDYEREQRLRYRITDEWRPALDNTTLIHLGDTDNSVNAVRVNGDAFFRASGLDMRSKLPTIVTNRIRQGTFPDATFGGVFPTLTRVQIEDWLWGWTPRESDWYYDPEFGWQGVPTGLSVGPYAFGLARNVPSISTNPLVARCGVEASNLRVGVSNSVPQMVILSSNLPPWANLDPFSGIITGTPGTNDITTNRLITVRLQAPPLFGGTNLFATNRTLSLRVLPPGPTFTSTNRLVWTQGVVGRFTNTVNLGNLPGYPVTYASSSLPAGLAMSPGGVISGTPSLAGNFNCVISASNAGGSTNQNLNLVIRPTGGFRLNDTDYIGRVGDDIRYQISFGPGFSNYICTTPFVADGTSTSLPYGLTMSASGLITGRPLQESSWYNATTPDSMANITVVARRNGVPVTNELVFAIANSLPILASPINVSATLNKPFRYQIVAGGPGREWAGYDSFEGTAATNWRTSVSSGANLVRSNGNLILNFIGTGTNATNRFAYLEWTRNLPDANRTWVAYGTAILPSNLVTPANRYAETVLQVTRNDGTTNFSAFSFAGRENAAGYSGGSHLVLDTFRPTSPVLYGFESRDGKKSTMVPVSGAMEFRSTLGSSQAVAVADTRYAALPTDQSWTVRAELQLTNVTWTNASAIGLALVKDRYFEDWFAMTAGTNNFPFASFALSNNTTNTNGARTLVLGGMTNTTTNRSILRLELAYDAVSGNLASAFYAPGSSAALFSRTNTLTSLIADVNPSAGDVLRLAMYGSTLRAGGVPAGTMRVRSLAVQSESTVSNGLTSSPVFLRNSFETSASTDSPTAVNGYLAIQAGRTDYGSTNWQSDFSDRGFSYLWNGSLSSTLRLRLGGDTLVGGLNNGRGTSAVGWEDFGVVPLNEVWFTATNLPAGLQLDENQVPGLIYGTPTARGTNNVTVIMETSGGSRTNTIRIVVQ